MRGLRPVFYEYVHSMTQDELRNVLVAKNVFVPTMKTLRTIVNDQLREQPASPVDPLLTNITICEQMYVLEAAEETGCWILQT